MDSSDYSITIRAAIAVIRHSFRYKSEYDPSRHLDRFLSAEMTKLRLTDDR